MLRGEEISPAKINSYLKKKKWTEDELLRVTAVPKQLPDYIIFERLEKPPLVALNTTPLLGPNMSPYVVSGGTSPWLNVPSHPPSLDLSAEHTTSSEMSKRTSLSSLHSTDYSALEDIADESYRHDAAQKQYEVGQQFGDSASEHEEDREQITTEDMINMYVAAAESQLFQAMIRQMLAPKPTWSKDEATRTFVRLLSATPPAMCNTPARQATDNPLETISLDVPDRDEDSHPTLEGLDYLGLNSDDLMAVDTEDDFTESSRFLAACFLICILRGQGHDEKASAAIKMARASFRRIVVEKPHHCLTTLNVLLPVLDSSGQRNVAEVILDSVLAVSSKTVDAEHPVISTLEFILDIVSHQAKLAEYDLSKLERAYAESIRRWGPEAPSALTAQYHVGWRLASSPTTCHKAWDVLNDLQSKCELILPPNHIQTISCMMTSARALYNMNDHLRAATLMNAAIGRLDEVYPTFHPYCLEARSRQAVFAMELGGCDIEGLLRSTVENQAAMLGLDNPKTRATLGRFQAFFRTQGRYEDAEKLPRTLRDISDDADGEFCD